MTNSSGPNLRQTVQQRAIVPAGAPSIFDEIERSRKAVERALPKGLGIDADRLLRIAITQVRTVPKLAECTVPSVLGGLVLSAQVGLPPGQPLGLSWLIPRWNKNSGHNEATWQMGYRGIIQLFRRSGEMRSIDAHEVCEADEFDFQYGVGSYLHHKPEMRQPRGPAWAYYAVAEMKDGGHTFVVLSKEDVEKRKARSSTANTGFSPWKSDYDAMARKTAIRALAPYLPLSAEVGLDISNVLAADNTVRDQEIAPNMAETYIPDDDEVAEGEIVEAGPQERASYAPGEEPFDVETGEVRS